MYTNSLLGDTSDLKQGRKIRKDGSHWPLQSLESISVGIQMCFTPEACPLGQRLKASKWASFTETLEMSFSLLSLCCALVVVAS